MSNNIKQLFETLELQCKTYRDYLSLHQRKTKTLVEGDIIGLDEVVLKEQSFIMKMESLEKKRMGLLSEDEIDNLTMNEIIERYISGEDKDKYYNICIELTGLIYELKRVNALNQKLLNQRLHIIEKFNKKLQNQEI